VSAKHDPKSQEEPRPAAPRTKRIVGRGRELGAIKDAVAGEGTHILCFVGSGGIGKTRILEEVTSLQSEPDALPFRWGGIIDLYHSEFRSPEGIEWAIVARLDPQGEHFVEYRRARERLRERRDAGVAAAALAMERSELSRIFVREYNELARRRRIVLAFDTLELLVFERDKVQEIVGVAQEAAEATDWFLEHLGEMENSVFLLAGRKEGPWESFETRFQHADLEFGRFDLQGLTPEESRDYFDEITELHPDVKDIIPPNMWQRIHDCTEGHPIRLSLVIDLALYGDISGLFPVHPDRDRDLDAIRRIIDQRLVQELLHVRDYPVRAMLHYLALTRKGLDTELLCDLEPEWGEQECREHLDYMKRFTFVKTRPGTDRVFLHDELYDLFDRFVLGAHHEYRERYKSIADFYWDKLNRADTREGRETLKVNLLHYTLRVDPWLAFWYVYVPWSTEAIKGYETSLDGRLRQELQSFLRSRMAQEVLPDEKILKALDQHEAINWLHRFLVRGKADQVLDAVRSILHSDYLAPEDAPFYDLFYGRLLTAKGEAQLYAAAPEEETRATLQSAIDILQKSLPSLSPPEHERGWWQKFNPDPIRWLRLRTIGRAYNDLGYLHRAAKRYHAATENYRQANAAFRAADIRDEIADTLNNLAFLYGSWGWDDRAEMLIRDALELRRRLGMRYALALSYNTQGLLEIFAEKPHRAVQSSLRALDMFEELEPKGGGRGVGLACIALGMAHRQQGELWKIEIYSPQESEGIFEEAERYLQRAAEIFRRVEEPMRLWEAQNELGSLYCDWGNLLRYQGRKKVARERYNKAIKYLEKSVSLAKKHGWQPQWLDSLDDLAQVYADLGNLPKAREYLDEILASIPDEYKLPCDGSEESEVAGFQEISEPVEEYWLALGKLHLQKAIWAFRRTGREDFKPLEALIPFDECEGLDTDALLQKAARHYALAFAYFTKYSPKHPRNKVTSKSFYRRISPLKRERLERIREIIEGVHNEYGVDLTDLVEVVDDVLGMEPFRKGET